MCVVCGDVGVCSVCVWCVVCMCVVYGVGCVVCMCVVYGLWYAVCMCVVWGVWRGLGGARTCTVCVTAPLPELHGRTPWSELR